MKYWNYASVDIELRVDLEAMQGWSAEQVRAFMEGIGQVMAVQEAQPPASKPVHAAAPEGAP